MLMPVGFRAPSCALGYRGDTGPLPEGTPTMFSVTALFLCTCFLGVFLPQRKHSRARTNKTTVPKNLSLPEK